MRVALFRSGLGRYTTVCDEYLGKAMSDSVRITEWETVTFKPRADLGLRDEVQQHIDEMETRS